MTGYGPTEYDLFTDGACSGNPGPGGWAYILRDQNGKEWVEYGSDRHTTNNRMELLAAIRGSERIATGSQVTLWSDSKYLVDGLNEWVEQWKKRGWKLPRNKPVKNVDLWQEMDELRSHLTMTANWVRGHEDHPENIRCDHLAVLAASEAKTAAE